MCSNRNSKNNTNLSIHSSLLDKIWIANFDNILSVIVKHKNCSEEKYGSSKPSYIVVFNFVFIIQGAENKLSTLTCLVVNVATIY